MQKIILFTSLFLFTLSVSWAQVSGNVNYEAGNTNYNNNNTKAYTKLPNASIRNDKEVILEVRALQNQEADAYVAIFSLTQVGKTIEEANKLLTDRYNGFVADAQEAGIAKSNIYLDMVSFVPLYEVEAEKKIFGKTYNEVPKGFEMQQNIHIKYTDQAVLSELLAVAGKYEIYDLVKVDYIVENQEAIFIALRKRAVAHLIKQSELYVDELGVDLESGYRIIAEDRKVAFPKDRYSSYEAFSSISLDRSANNNKNKEVNKVRKPRTMYYDKVNYDFFDIVVNPNVVEPAVQFMTHVTLKIELQGHRELKEYFWLTPDGEKVKVDPRN